MKLLWVSHLLPFPPTGHGALQRTHNLVRQLASAFEVELFALSNGAGTQRDLLEMGVKVAHLAPLPGTLRKIGAVGASAIAGTGYWHHLLADPSLRSAFARSVTSGSVVLLDTVFLAPYVRQFTDLRIILNHHNIESTVLTQRAEGLSGIGRAFFLRQAAITRLEERRLAAIARVNLIVSREDAALLEEIAPGASSCIVPNGVDIDFFRRRSGASVAPHSLVFAGSMDWFPNRDAIRWFAAEIWPQVVAAEPRRTWTVVGKSPPEELLALARRDSRVTVTGFVPDVRPYLERAAAYVCPIRLGGGTRLKVLDALAVKIPLVATTMSVGGLGLTPGRHYLPANRADHFVSALARLDADPSCGASLAEQGRLHVEAHFSWSRIGRDLIAALPSWLES